MDGYQTYEHSQPWVCYGYPVADSEIPTEGGESRVNMLCAICGERGVAILRVPPVGTPEPSPSYRHPDRVAFLDAHRHPMQYRAPETWALPLLNPAAHGDTLDILRDVAEKARRSDAS